MMTIPDHMNITLLEGEKSITFCCIVLEEDLDDIDMLRPREWIATNANTERLPESHTGRLSDSLVRQCTRPRHDPYIEIYSPCERYDMSRNVPIFPGL